MFEVEGGRIRVEVHFRVEVSSHGFFLCYYPTLRGVAENMDLNTMSFEWDLYDYFLSKKRVDEFVLAGDEVLAEDGRRLSGAEIFALVKQHIPLPHVRNMRASKTRPEGGETQAPDSGRDE